MKKLVMLLVAAGMASAISAQTNYDPNPHKKEVMAIDALMKDPRNTTRAQNWFKKGEVYLQATLEPRKGLAKSMTRDDLVKIAGEPSAKKEATLKNQEYDVYVYNNYDAYFPKGKNLLSFWAQKVEIVENGLDVAFEAFSKAYEMSKPMEDRIKSRIRQIPEEFKQEADMAIPIDDNRKMRNAFVKAYEYGKHPLINKTDSLMAYNAGYISILLEDFDTSIKYLREAQGYGLENDGEVYKLLYYAYSGKKDNENAEKVLVEGIEKYPGNTELIELLLTHYSNAGKDISELTGLIEATLAKDPNNYNLNFGMGIIYDKMNDNESAIKYFKKASEISPNEFGPFFNWGVAQARLGDKLVGELNEIPNTKPDDYMAKLAEVHDAYKAAILPLEKAHELRPDEPNAIQLLKNFYFRFKDEDPTMAAKYEKLGGQ